MRPGALSRPRAALSGACCGCSRSAPTRAARCGGNAAQRAPAHSGSRRIGAHASCDTPHARPLPRARRRASAGARWRAIRRSDDVVHFVTGHWRSPIARKRAPTDACVEALVGTVRDPVSDAATRAYHHPCRSALTRDALSDDVPHCATGGSRTASSRARARARRGARQARDVSAGRAIGATVLVAVQMLRSIVSPSSGKSAASRRGEASPARILRS